MEDDLQVLHSTSNEGLRGFLVVDYDTNSPRTPEEICLGGATNRRRVFGMVVPGHDYYGIDSGLRIPADASNLTVYFKRAGTPMGDDNAETQGTRPSQEVLDEK